MTRRTTFLTAIFLALWLPSQALATVLAHCASLDFQSVPVMSDLKAAHASHSPASDGVGEDCHGQAIILSDATQPPSAHHADITDCVHCTGGCHKLQSMLVFERDGKRFPANPGNHISSSSDLAAGYPDFPIRPPINILSV